MADTYPSLQIRRKKMILINLLLVCHSVLLPSNQQVGSFLLIRPIVVLDAQVQWDIGLVYPKKKEICVYMLFVNLWQRMQQHDHLMRRKVYMMSSRNPVIVMVLMYQNISIYFTRD